MQTSITFEALLQSANVGKGVLLWFDTLHAYVAIIFCYTGVVANSVYEFHCLIWISGRVCCEGYSLCPIQS